MENNVEARDFEYAILNMVYSKRRRYESGLLSSRCADYRVICIEEISMNNRGNFALYAEITKKEMVIT